MYWIFKIIGLLPFVNWLSPSFEDNTGHASYRRLTPFFLTGAAIYIAVVQISDEKIKMQLVYAFLIISAFFASIITFQNIYSLYVAWKGGPPVPTPPDTPPAEPIKPADPPEIQHIEGDVKLT